MKFAVYMAVSFITFFHILSVMLGYIAYHRTILKIYNTLVLPTFYMGQKIGL